MQACLAILVLLVNLLTKGITVAAMVVLLPAGLAGAVLAAVLLIRKGVRLVWSTGGV